jgi:beta-alanine degradation protein BauB
MTTQHAFQRPHRTNAGWRLALAAAALALNATSAAAQDPAHTDGDKYKVRFENSRVRVLEYRDLPGEKTHEHRHPAFVLYAVGPFKRRIHLPDGKVLMREFKAGDVMWSDAQTHIGENVGDTPTHVIMVEMK